MKPFIKTRDPEKLQDIQPRMRPARQVGVVVVTFLLLFGARSAFAVTFDMGLLDDWACAFAVWIKDHLITMVILGYSLYAIFLLLMKVKVVEHMVAIVIGAALVPVVVAFVRAYMTKVGASSTCAVLSLGS